MSDFNCAHIQILIFFSSSLFNYRFPYCIQLYTWSTQQVIVAQHMCWFLKASNPPMFTPINFFQLHPIRADGFPFPSIYGSPYPTFQSHPVLLPSDVILALLLVGGLSHLCIFYHNCKGSCWIPSVAWPGRDISRKLNHLWILSWRYTDYIFFGSFWLVLWHRKDIPRRVFGYCPLSTNLGFFGADIMSSGKLLRWRLCLWLIIFSWYASVSLLIFLLDVVSNGLFLSLQNMDDRIWNWGTVRWRWAYGIQMTWILALCVLLIQRGRVNCYLALSPLWTV